MLHLGILVTSPLSSAQSLKVETLSERGLRAVASPFQISRLQRCDLPAGSTSSNVATATSKDLESLVYEEPPDILNFSPAAALSHQLQPVTTDQTAAEGPLHCRFSVRVPM